MSFEQGVAEPSASERSSSASLAARLVTVQQALAVVTRLVGGILADQVAHEMVEACSDLLSVGQAAQFEGVSKDTIKKRILRRVAREDVQRIGGRIYVERTVLEATGVIRRQSVPFVPPRCPDGDSDKAIAAPQGAQRSKRKQEVA